MDSEPANGDIAPDGEDQDEAEPNADNRPGIGRSNGEASDWEQPPDDRRRPESLSPMRPVGTAGLPAPWVRPLDGNVSLSVPPDADLPHLYSAALSALVAEIKRTGAGQKRYELENGVREERKAGETVYTFAFTDETDLFEDAKVAVELPGRRIDASIVSISSGCLRLATKEDLGDVLHRAIILVDTTALLDALKEKIEQVGKGEITLNRDMADAVVGKTVAPTNPAPIPAGPLGANLNTAQVCACRKALTASITYLWGPPGCGKTHTLGEVVKSALGAGKRTLICSNTNKAVDQVLYTICETLGVGHPAMEEGRIVRLGRIAHDKLATKYDAYVTVDGILERRSAELKARRALVQEEIARIDAKTSGTRDILDRFAQLDNAQRSVDFHQEATNKVVRVGMDLKSEQQTILTCLEEFRKRTSEPKGRRVRVFQAQRESNPKRHQHRADPQGELRVEDRRRESPLYWGSGKV